MAATHIKCDTYLETDHSSPWSQRLLDAIISRVMELSVVLLWHGTWTLMDLLSEEEAWLGLDKAHSAWFSLAVGWTGGLLLLAAQFLVLILNYWSSRSLKCIFHVIFYIYILLGMKFNPIIHNFCLVFNFRCIYNHCQFSRVLVPHGFVLPSRG